jgi:hypothetical protein
VLSGRGLCVGKITRWENSYRVWCIWVWSWSLDEALAHTELLHHGQKIYFSESWEANRSILPDTKSLSWDSKQGHFKEERRTPNTTPWRPRMLWHVVFVRQTGIYCVLYCNNDVTFILHNYGNWKTYFSSSGQTHCVNFTPRYILLHFTSEHKDEVKASKSWGQKTIQLEAVSIIPLHICIPRTMSRSDKYIEILHNLYIKYSSYPQFTKPIKFYRHKGVDIPCLITGKTGDNQIYLPVVGRVKIQAYQLPWPKVQPILYTN